MLPMCHKNHKSSITNTNSKVFCKRSIIASPKLSHHKAVSAVRITVVTDKFTISWRSLLTKASYTCSLATHLEMSFLFIGKGVFLFGHPLRNIRLVFRKELPKSCNYIFGRQKPVGVDFFLLVLFGRFVVRSALAFLGTAILFETLTASLVDLDQ